jgi:hypothetical protein
MNLGICKFFWLFLEALVGAIVNLPFSVDPLFMIDTHPGETDGIYGPCLPVRTLGN